MPISSIENVIFMLLILINATYSSDTNCRIVFTILRRVFKHARFTNNLAELKRTSKTKFNMKKKKKKMLIFKFTRNYRRTIMMHSSRSDSNGLHRMAKNGTLF